ncbi:hypothetical protein ACE6H2_001264 [Prunus campanulata]
MQGQSKPQSRKIQGTLGQPDPQSRISWSGRPRNPWGSVKHADLTEGNRMSVDTIITEGNWMSVDIIITEGNIFIEGNLN